MHGTGLIPGPPGFLGVLKGPRKLVESLPGQELRCLWAICGDKGQRHMVQGNDSSFSVIPAADGPGFPEMATAFLSK